MGLMPTTDLARARTVTLDRSSPVLAHPAVSPSPTNAHDIAAPRHRSHLQMLAALGFVVSLAASSGLLGIISPASYGLAVITPAHVANRSPLISSRVGSIIIAGSLIASLVAPALASTDRRSTSRPLAQSLVMLALAMSLAPVSAASEGDLDRPLLSNRYI